MLAFRGIVSIGMGKCKLPLLEGHHHLSLQGSLTWEITEEVCVWIDRWWHRVIRLFRTSLELLFINFYCLAFLLIIERICQHRFLPPPQTMTWSAAHSICWQDKSFWDCLKIFSSTITFFWTFNRAGTTHVKGTDLPGPNFYEMHDFCTFVTQSRHTLVMEEKPNWENAPCLLTWENRLLLTQPLRAGHLVVPELTSAPNIVGGKGE